MNKEQKAVIVEYVSGLFDEPLKFLTLRLMEKLSGDVPDSLNEISKDKKMDLLLSSIESNKEFCDIIDNVRDILHKECKRRGLLLRLQPHAA